MKITVFTSNQPRHIALIKALCAVASKTLAVIECNTVFPGKVRDFYEKSNAMRKYFTHVIRAEGALFGDLTFSPARAAMLSIKSGDLNLLQKDQLTEALSSDVFVVFGASYIKGWLADFLVERRAINIHMGVSPYYRGSSCNFWALHDSRPELVGATIHLLSKGLDSGAMLYHAMPRLEDTGPFEFTMRAVQAAQASLVEMLASGEIFKMKSENQNKADELRYTRNADFTDEVAEEFLARNWDARELSRLLAAAERPKLLRPHFI